MQILGGRLYHNHRFLEEPCPLSSHHFLMQVLWRTGFYYCGLNELRMHRLIWARVPIAKHIGRRISSSFASDGEDCLEIGSTGACGGFNYNYVSHTRNEF